VDGRTRSRPVTVITEVSGPILRSGLSCAGVRGQRAVPSGSVAYEVSRSVRVVHGRIQWLAWLRHLAEHLPVAGVAS
jgi:hypothetical protein